MIINADPIAIGARLPAPGSMTHIPTVRTRKNVPMNSVRYFFIGENVRFGGSLVPHFINTTTFARGIFGPDEARATRIPFRVCSSRREEAQKESPWEPRKTNHAKTRLTV